MPGKGRSTRDSFPEFSWTCRRTIRAMSQTLLRNCLGLVTLLLVACVTPPPTASAPPDPNSPKPIRASKIVLIGDSTTAVQGGWGGAFCADHVVSFAACVNLARGGRSSG